MIRFVSQHVPLYTGRALRHTNRSWRVDETYIRVAGKWTYLYRAVDSDGNTLDFMHRRTAI